MGNENVNNTPLSPPKKRPRRHFSSEEKHTVLNTFKVCEEQHTEWTKNEKVESVAKSMGISVASVYNILREHKQHHYFDSPKKYHRAKAVLDYISEEDKEAIRRLAHSFLLLNEPFSLDKLLIKVNEDEDLPNFKRSTLGKLLKEIDFRNPEPKMTSNVNCCVPGCNSVYKNNPELTFHQLPKEGQRIEYVDELGIPLTVDRRKMWETKLKMENRLSGIMRVCSRHFVEDDFLTPRDWGYKKRFLKRTAVPNQNLPTSSTITKKSNWKIRPMKRRELHQLPCAFNMQQEKDNFTDTDAAEASVELGSEDMAVKCEFPNETTVTLQNSPKKQKFFDCSDAIAPFGCFQCTKFETYKLVDLKRHFKSDHTLFQSKEELYACGNCNFQTHSKYLILRHDVFKTCIIDGIKSESAIPGEIGDLQVKEERLTNSDDVDCVTECNDPSEDTTELPQFEYCDFRTQADDLLKYFQCSRCPFKTQLKSLLFDHVESTHKPRKNKSLKCEFCSYVATRANDLKRHNLYKHADPDKIEWFECEHCPYKCKRSSDLKIHVDRKHGKSAKFKCDHCQFEIKSRQGLQYHVLTRHTDPQWFHCEHCSYKTKRKSHLRTHLDFEHYNKEKFKCDHCEFETKFKQSLKHHVLLKHTDPGDTDWFICEHCPYKTKRRCDLKTHVDYVHENKPKFKCDHCKFQTKFKQSLKSHILLKHTDPDEVVAFRCEHCRYFTTSSATLKRHILVKHADPNNIEWFHCELCPYKARLKAYLVSHTLMKHHQT